MRYSAIQNVTLNLPRAAYRSDKSDEKLFEQLTKQMELAVLAHIQKRAFLEELLNLGNDGPLSLLAMKKDGEPYLRLRRVTHLIGMLGLNELVQFHTGQELHESDESVKFGMKVIAFMKLKCEEFSRTHNMHFVLEQTPAESTAYRFAKLDMKHYPDAASKVIKGNTELNNIYYTNSTYFNVSQAMNPIDRVVKEGLFHPLIDAGALTHVWLGEARPSSSSIANFVVKTFRNSSNSQIAFSPEFTTCNSCGKTVRGIKEKCASCGSTEVECMTRITGYFSKISGWNKGKLGELADRYKNREYFPPEADLPLA
jgi:ribonucleoside-triphosphate reductase